MIPAPDLVLKQFKVGIFGEFFLLKRNNCCFAGCVHKTYIATHLDIYKSILFKLGMVRDAAILYIWCCSNWPWPSFKVIGGWWGVANLGKCPQKVLYRFWDMLVSWTSYLFHLVWWAFREKNLLTWFHQKSWCCLVFEHFLTNLFQNVTNDRHHWTLQFDTSLSDSDLHKWSQLYEDANSCTHFLANFSFRMYNI